MFFSCASLSSRHSKYSQKESCSAFLAFSLLSQINPMPTYILFSVPWPSTRNTTPLFLCDLEISGIHHQYVCCGSGFCLFQKLYTTNTCVLVSLLLLYCSNNLKHLHTLFFYIPPMLLHRTAIKLLHVLSSFLLRLKKVVRRGICSVSLPLCHNSRTRAPKCSSCLALCVTTYQCPILPKKIRGGTVRLFCSILSL